MPSATVPSRTVSKNVEGNAPKIKIFMWKALSNALSVNDGLLPRGLKIDLRCQRCGMEGESINHVLFSCPAARHVWAQSNFPFVVLKTYLCMKISITSCSLKEVLKPLKKSSVCSHTLDSMEKQKCFFA